MKVYVEYELTYRSREPISETTEQNNEGDHRGLLPEDYLKPLIGRAAPRVNPQFDPKATPVEAISEVGPNEEASETEDDRVSDTSYIAYLEWVADVLQADLRGADLEIELALEQRDEARELAQRRSQWWSDYWRERTQREYQSSDITEQACGRRY